MNPKNLPFEWFIYEEMMIRSAKSIGCLGSKCDLEFVQVFVSGLQLMRASAKVVGLRHFILSPEA